MLCDTDTVLDLLDATYALEQPTETWLHGVASRLDRALGDGSGSLAMITDLRGSEHAAFEHVTPIGGGDWWRSQLALFEQMPIGMMRNFSTGPVFYWSQTAASVLQHDADTAALLDRTARADYGTDELAALELARAGSASMLIERLVFTTLSPFGRGVSAVVPHRAVAARRPGHAELTVWGRIAAHVATAFRLHRGSQPVEAVLEPDGRLVDATGPAQEERARDALRAAAIAQDKIRSRRGRRIDAESATDAWRAVVHGRWSLVDQFERDGRRYLVAKVNPAETTGMSQLTRQQAQIVELAARGYTNKLIAYEIGVSVATIVRALSAAARVLGTTSRVDLIRAVLTHRT
jgi:DNA-binding CsgD family transcriptional regulator